MARALSTSTMKEYGAAEFKGCTSKHSQAHVYFQLLPMSRTITSVYSIQLHKKADIFASKYSKVETWQLLSSGIINQ